MRVILLALTCMFVQLFCLNSISNAQNPANSFRSDSVLMLLVDKYIQTPVATSVTPSGEIFLQRDLNEYLGRTVFQNRNSLPAADDHGHDHKNDMLREFLNRPHPSVQTLHNYFQQAAIEFNVPVEILRAVAQVQSNWTQMSESMYGSWGVMGIIENPYVQQITQAAQLTGASPLQIKETASANIRAAAALLAHYQQNRGTASTLEDWFQSVKDLTGLTDEAMKHDLALRIYQVMKSGCKSVTLWGEIIRLNPVNVTMSRTMIEPDVPRNSNRSASTVDYPNAVANFTTCNFNNRPAGSVPRYYFVHYIATGTYQGAISWFKNCTSSVSAHYVIRNHDGEISQVVAEDHRAWSQGVTAYNDLGIGVEHEVLASNLAMWDSDPMLTAAANLAINVCNRRSIPKTRRVNNGDPGIYGHSDVRATDCPNMTAARWTAFLSRVGSVNVAAPTLFSIGNPGIGTQLVATWKANIEPTLLGYRLYYSTNDALTNWALAANETSLTAATTSITLDASQFVVPPSGDVYHFKLTAVVSNGSNPPVESSGSDIYSRSSNTSGPTVLIVDGFDRTNGSWTASTHFFVTSYFKALRNKAALRISSVANEKVEDGTVSLNNYDFVVWFVGDESSANVVFSNAEKNAITAYLNNGGKLIVSGSEIAYNIGRSASSTYDLAFMNNYLKSNYLNDGSATYTPASGIASTAFDGLSVPFGVVYVEDFPDAITPINGSTSILSYNVSPNIAGIAYKGTFGPGTTPGGVIFLGFTLETAADSVMAAFMGKAMEYFNVPVVTIPSVIDDAATTQSGSAKRINVLSNDYGNGVAINAASLTIVTQPSNGTVTKDNGGNVTYVSNSSFTGTDVYQYRVQNLTGQQSNIATVSMSVVASAACDPSSPEVEDLFPKRDLRGAWISTVSNIDWPSSRTLSTAQQQAELIKMLDTLAKTGINTVFLQVRPESDALYASTIEPWSYWLTNSQGTAPNPLWDPLSFAIDQAHARGMELHAWLNPYRAKQSTPTLASNHVAVQNPSWVFTAGTLTMLDPGLPQVRNHVTNVIMDIATRYDVDGIHFDDYFYPSSNFTNQDANTYANNNPTNIATIEDWRRNNVNLLIENVYNAINTININNNKNIVFGVSPFGIWKSGTPAGISGTSSFSAMYCDPIAWLQAGKVDYVAPQLYWKITGPQDYNALSKWWNDQGLAYNRFVYPGLALYKMVDANNWAASEIENQITLNRDQSREQVKGEILFSAKHITTDSKGLKTSLQNNLYKYKAIPPPLPWKDAVCPNAPVNVRQDGAYLRWDVPAAASDGDLPRKYVVYKFNSQAEAATHLNDGSKIYDVVGTNAINIPASEIGSTFVVTALDKNNNESEAGLGVTLPVTGFQITASLQNNITAVRWTTLSEIQTSYFEVERSSNGSTYKRIASVTAAGNSLAANNYNVNDVLTEEGLYYYRIKIVDRDGKFRYSPVVTVNFKAGLELIASPNPFAGVLNVTNLKNVKQIQLMDATGRVVANKVVSGEASLVIQTNNLPAGFYTLKAVYNDGRATFVRLIK